MHRAMRQPEPAERIGKDLVAASATALLLSILQRGPSYGYAIIQEVRALSGGELEWSEGMLYPVLHRMEDQRLIASFESDSADTGRKRRYYKLLTEGRRALVEQRRQWDVVNTALTNAWRIA